MKRILSLLIILLFSNIVLSQYTAIPDANFEQALIDLGLDATLDGQVITANIDTLTELYVDSLNISDLTGIEDFTELTLLMCFYNQLSSLNITQNDSLKYLYCSSNQLTTIDLSNNNILVSLGVYKNQITHLNLSQNPNLAALSCGVNPITSLDLSLQQYLGYIDCSFSPSLQCLNMNNSNNQNVIYFNAINCPNLTCIEVDNVVYSTTNWTNIDAGVSFSTNCSNSCSVDINEYNFNNLSLYPNPTTGNITIDLGNSKHNVKAILTNSLGQVILTQQFVSPVFINIDIEAPSGIYFLQLITPVGESKTIKILKE